MNATEINQSTQTYLRLITPLIIVYLLVLALIDRWFYSRPTLSVIFYLVMLGVAGLLLAITRVRGVQRFLGNALFPVIISLLVIGPILASFISSVNQWPLPQGRPVVGPEMETLRLVPLSFTALVLVAWLYRMQHVILFGLLVTLTLSFLALYYNFHNPGNPLAPWLTVITIQFVSFVIVGYFINLLVRQLKSQQTALAEANVRLVDYASTLENLTISRERNAMARELHDTVAHTLSGLSVQLETTLAYLDVDLDTAKTMLSRSLEITRSGLQDTRRALVSLRATPLDDLGLINALRELAENTSKRGNLSLTLNLPLVDLHLPAAYEQVIFRITQEALTNILQHANAQKIEISLTRHQAEIHLLVSDDGLGFNLEQQAQEHFGLVGMRERAELVGGSLQFQSEPGKGTQILLILRNLR